MAVPKLPVSPLNLFPALTAVFRFIRHKLCFEKKIDNDCPGRLFDYKVIINHNLTNVKINYANKAGATA